jgi:hypothetical protein
VHLFDEGGVAIAGQDHQVRVRASASASFLVPPQECTGSWQGVWAEPGGQRIFLAGEGRLGVYHPVEGTCVFGAWAHASASAGSYLRSLVGFGAGGSVELHGVGENKNLNTGSVTGGRSVVWDGSESPLPSSSRKDHTYVLADVHGTSHSALFAVGGTLSDGRIYRYVESGSGWTYQGSLGTEMLRAVWVVSPTLVVAGGTDGALFRFDGDTWHELDGPDGGDIVSLVAFGSSSLYAVSFSAGATASSDSSRVYRYDGSGWTQLGATFSPGKLRDLAATRPDDLWVVGRDGVVAHWP